jgi:hypothetical protein
MPRPSPFEEPGAKIVKFTEGVDAASIGVGALLAKTDLRELVGGIGWPVAADRGGRRGRRNWATDDRVARAFRCYST